ncbi:hypothetical protein LB518_10110 [Mesorhizobium sp. BR1-1-16]|uniref:hypothetical protein n=1 Tax=Mesorhizobium sp. BR1-1-16 TaxID=2876653 RepID=UPI001CCF58E7|nr:hypothetical protein [Mesorhizobium sp. BR1-1-16]MBZ9936649.1 hypothetical protein [Mesorhizobium sp. BR1-1-16]
MTDDIDYDDPYASFDDAETARVRAEIAHLAQTEGLRVAYSAAVDLARDKKTPAAARGGAARTLLEIAGMLNQRDRAAAEAVNKDPSEMTPAELHAELRRLGRLRRARDRSAELDDEPSDEPLNEDDPGVFG